MRLHASLLILAWLALAGAASAVTVNISGGGTNVLSGAVTANSATGADIVITDSATYTQTADLFLGLRYSGTNGRRGFNITAAPGQTPTIVMSGSIIVIYAGSADCSLGSNAGGRITLDATAGGGQAIWYIGQEDGAPAGPASKATFENVEMIFTGRNECIIFGAGGNDGSPLTTGARMDLNNVTLRGGNVQIKTLYGPANYASTFNITNSFLYGASGGEGWNLEAGAFGLGGNNSVVNITRSIIYNASGVTATDPNCFVQRLGVVNIDHSDLVCENGGRGSALVGGTNSITNSIVYGGAGLVAFGGTGTATDSNVHGTLLTQSGYTLTNCIDEWPVYWAVGTDPFNLDQFAVPPSTASRTHGSAPPLGARGSASVPVEISGFAIE